ncbi:hypothetical protein D9611_001070 [Ephemerocybe angulata]|uniref:Uncharacterized protein n=1 Tax=Ephemerocybe angulata TaxID=980116 RepID=A0A8H5BMX8_9AGAR|nr:hypothetical protein D9611_001070 [Tulosesus angulatus]
MRFSTAAVAIAAATLGGSVVSAIPVPNQATALAQLEARETAQLIDSILEARGYMDGEVEVSKRGVRSAVGGWLRGKLGIASADPNAAAARSLDAEESASTPAPRPKHHGQGNNGKHRKGNRKDRKHRKTRKNGQNGNRQNGKHAKVTDAAAAGGADGAVTDGTTGTHPAAHAKSSSTSPAPVADASTTTLTARELEEFIEILRRAGEDGPQRRPSHHNGEAAKRRARHSRTETAQHEA